MMRAGSSDLHSFLMLPLHAFAARQGEARHQHGCFAAFSRGLLAFRCNFTLLRDEIVQLALWENRQYTVWLPGRLRM